MYHRAQEGIADRLSVNHQILGSHMGTKQAAMNMKARECSQSQTAVAILCVLNLIFTCSSNQSPVLVAVCQAQ